MMPTSFQGREALVEKLDRAVQHTSVPEITEAVKNALLDLLSARTPLGIPPEFKVPRGDKYARRLLYRSPEHGYTVIAMTWGPQQGTLLHDHSGTWCVEGVLEGEIEVTQYDLLEREGNSWHFVPQDTLHSGMGTAGSLIPPYEYHTIANARPERPSITVHVYGRELTNCTIFENENGDWYTSRLCPLRYDN